MEVQTQAIEIRKLRKSFGPRTVLKGLDLTVRRGEALVILGPNGAGKSTLIKIICGLTRPTSGKVEVMGMDLATEGADIRGLVGLVPHQPLLYDDLSAYENLKFYGKMFRVPDLENRIEFLLDKVGLKARARDRVGVFSRGMLQRLSLARAVLHDPPLVLLDEPETGLDQEARAMLKEVVAAPAERPRTILMTTHSLEHGLKMADRVAILVGGKLVYDECARSLDLGGLESCYRQYTGVAKR